MSKSEECMLLMDEREKTTFSLEEMTHLLDGGKCKTDLRQSIEKVILSDPRMKPEDISCMSPQQQHNHGVKRMIYFYTDLAKKMSWDFTDSRCPELEFLPRTVGMATSLMLHASAFIPSVAQLGTKEQVAKWYTLGKEYFILGCYAQTELGHVGKGANHALVMAQLIIQGKSYGMHAFLVQIRDLTSHRPMPGVTVGSIGPLMSMGGSDNGYLSFKSVRIPKANMLARYAEVSADGTYIKKGDTKLMHASMVNLRVLMTKGEAVLGLEKACTIAARYSCVRRQGSLQPSKPEIQVIEYVTQQHKIISQIATAYAMHFTIQHVQAIYNQFLQDLDEGKVGNLTELHFVTAGVKASMTEQSVEGIETVRRACGGHGFAHSSGLPALLQRAIPSCTYEGDNTVMYLFCARHLLRCAQKVFMGQPLEGSVKYLSAEIQNKCRANKKEDFINPNILLACLQHKAQAMLLETATYMQYIASKGMNQMDVWNISSVQLVNVVKAHMLQYIFSTFLDFINETYCSPPIRDVLLKLCALYGIYNINNNATNLLKDGYLNGEQCTLMERVEVDLLQDLRKNVVGLVDSFDFRDEILNSCLGAYDGNVYERLFENAKNSPMNKDEVHEETYKYLRPHLHKGRDILKKMSKL
ncbi:unnamed protein product [Clavelina lepadiformis]|uniref:Acyl-coenzyme A oxidase n=2 Tax=Clavelina lepadiformis TaxID=159417 RepID=A0ABP0FW34_CLALP